jgi:hypothetical protein
MSKEKLAALVANERQQLPVAIANAHDPDKDKHGSCSDLLAGQLRCIGVADFVLHGDVASFQKHLSEAAEIQVELFRRHTAGEAVDASFVSMLAYQRLFDALAAGNNASAASLASLMGGRDDIEKKHDHRFDYAMGVRPKNSAGGKSPEKSRFGAGREREFVSARQVQEAVLPWASCRYRQTARGVAEIRI